MKWFHLKKGPELNQYAPDASLTATAYVEPVSEENRSKNAEKQMQHFLAETDPDSLCDAFYDRMAESENAVLLALLQQQRPGHADAILSIVRLHQAEQLRVQNDLSRTESAIAAYESEIETLEKLYRRYNGLEELP